MIMGMQGLPPRGGMDHSSGDTQTVVPVRHRPSLWDGRAIVMVMHSLQEHKDQHHTGIWATTPETQRPPT